MAIRTPVKRPRTTAKSDGIDSSQGGARLFQQLLDHRQQLLRVQARDHLVVARNDAIVQQGNGASFSRGVQGQQGADRCGCPNRKKVRQYKQQRPASGPLSSEPIVGSAQCLQHLGSDGFYRANARDVAVLRLALGSGQLLVESTNGLVCEW